MVNEIMTWLADVGIAQSLIVLAAISFVLYTALVYIVSVGESDTSSMGVLERLVLSVKVGALFSMLTVAFFWGVWHMQYSKMTESTFNAEVVSNVEDFKGSAECTESGLHVKGVYALQDASLGDTTMTVDVELDNTFTDMKGACAQQRYIDKPAVLDAILKAVANKTVDEQKNTIVAVVPKTKPHLTVAKSGLISVNTPAANVNTQTLAVAVGKTSVVVSSTTTPTVPLIPPARPAPDVSKNISGQ